MAKQDEIVPVAKRRRSYRVCEHCGKEVNIKIYREHKRLYFDAATKTWAKDHDDVTQSSSELSSFDDCDLGEESNDPVLPEHSQSDSFGWDDPSSEKQYAPEKQAGDSTGNDLSHQGAKYWVESDLEIDEDLALEDATIPPSDISLEPSQDTVEINVTIRWFVTLLSIFQTQFYLTNRALSWLLTFLFVVFRFLGRYSTKVAELALHFPRSLHQYGSIISNVIPINSFERRAVCVSCDSLYKFEECFKKVGTQTVILKSKSKAFRKHCNQSLMKQVISCNDTAKFYPHKIYCYVSLISSLQTLLMRSGFVEQCESTRNQFSTSGLSDVYDGSIWRDFLTVNNVPFLGKSHNYGLDTSALSKIEARLKNTIAPPGVGRVPVSINRGTFLTADQWKNWTLYYSIYCLGDLLPKPQLECWRKFVLACRRLVKHTITDEDILIADGLLLRFCKRSAELYGDDAINPNMHMHCHLAACLREFGPIHSFWLFPFEQYNGILEGQPSNNRSIELQLMRRFQKDNLNLQLHQEARQWPNSDQFLDALPSPAYDILSPSDFDQSVSPGSKYVINSLSPDLVCCLSNLYSKLYPSHKQHFDKGEIFIPSTFQKYSTIKWHGYNLTASSYGNAKNSYVFVTPPFSFTSSTSSEFEGTERLAKVEHFLVHTISLPGVPDPVPHLLACVTWPMVHPNRHYFGKPVEVWCKSVYEPQTINKFCLASTISSRAFIAFESVCSENVCIAISLVE